MAAQQGCKYLDDAKQFYENGMEFYRKGEPYGALVNLALAANTLDSLQTYHKAADPKCLDPEWCLEQKVATCSLQSAKEHLLKMVAVLQGRVKTLREGAGVGGAAGEAAGECGPTQGTEVKFEEGTEACQFWFDTVIGLGRAKREIQDGMINPLIYPNMYPKISKGILLYGPPGTGKTLLAKAAVNELKAADPSIDILFFAPKGSDLKGKFVGETEQKIANLFSCASEFACRGETADQERYKVSFLFPIMITMFLSASLIRKNLLIATVIKKLNF